MGSGTQKFKSFSVVIFPHLRYNGENIGITQGGKAMAWLEITIDTASEKIDSVVTSLTAAGFVASEGDAVVAQPESAITMIRLLYSLIPMVLMVLLAVTAFILSRLSKKMPEIEAKIAENAEVE